MKKTSLLLLKPLFENVRIVLKIIIKKHFWQGGSYVKTRTI
ncbi:hypothetical protein HMPREF9218_1089 [Lactobacillus iners LEAF 2062A-h1]|nr:hypothetical protein HMPREF9218_1089 [Lactobacillus iners LEAF 2062A-h1]